MRIRKYCKEGVLLMKEFLECVKGVYESPREKSWEHCRRFFLENRNNPEQNDTMCLHLACYLASFGMYRNSFLLENDYKIHSNVVEKLCSIEDKYWHFDPFIISANELDESLVYLTGEIRDVLSTSYSDIKRKTSMTNNNANRSIISDTLITKVLMGTLGCVPAFDERLRKGLKNSGLKQTYTKNNMKEIIAMIKAKGLESEIYMFCDMHNVYTPMRVVDMYLWALGCE